MREAIEAIAYDNVRAINTNGFNRHSDYTSLKDLEFFVSWNGEVVAARVSGGTFGYVQIEMPDYTYTSASPELLFLDRKGAEEQQRAQLDYAIAEKERELAELKGMVPPNE